MPADAALDRRHRVVDELRRGHGLPAQVHPARVGHPVEAREGGLVVQLLALLEQLRVDLAERIGVEEAPLPELGHVGEVVLVLRQQVLVGDLSVDDLELLPQIVQRLEGGGLQSAVREHLAAADLAELRQLEPQRLEVFGVLGDRVRADLLHRVQTQHHQVVPERIRIGHAQERPVACRVLPGDLRGGRDVGVVLDLLEIVVQLEERAVGEGTGGVGVGGLDVHEVRQVARGEQGGELVAVRGVGDHRDVEGVDPELLLELLPDLVLVAPGDRSAPEDLEARDASAGGGLVRDHVAVLRGRADVEGGDSLDVAEDEPLDALGLVRDGNRQLAARPAPGAAGG